MATKTYITRSTGNAVLDGHCEIDGHDCKTYHSDVLGTTTPTNDHGSGWYLKFKVDFGSAGKYTIKANKNGKGFRGDSTDDNDAEAEDPWVATATGEPAVAAKATS